MKKQFLNICWIANIIAIIYLLAPFLLLNYNKDLMFIFFVSKLGMAFFYSLSILSIILWIYCLYKYNKVTSNPIHLILLIFLSSIYVPIFYLIFIKNKSSQ
jgi:hypothetical protein